MKDVISVLVYVQSCTLRKTFNNYNATVINGSVQYISQLSIHSNFRTLHVRLAVISFITEQFKLQYYISRGWMAMDAVCKQTSTQIWTWYGHALGLVMQMLLDVQPYTVTLYCVRYTDVDAHHWLNSFTFLHMPWSVPFSLIHTEIFDKTWGCPLSHFLHILMVEKGEQQRKRSIYIHTLRTKASSCNDCT